MGSKSRKKINDRLLQIYSIITVILIAIISLVFFEMCFRIYDVASGKITNYNYSELSTNKHPILVYTAKKNFKGDTLFLEPGKRFSIETNSNGFRTHEFYPKLPGEYRIMILGDSFTFGWNANQNETYPAVLESLLQSSISKKITIYSLGVEGYSPLKYVLLMKLYFDVIQPDMIIVAVDQSDFDEDKNLIQKYVFDGNDMPMYPKDIQNLVDTRNIPFTDIDSDGQLLSNTNKIWFSRLKFGFSTAKYLSIFYDFLINKVSGIKTEMILNNYRSGKYPITTYFDLLKLYGYDISEHIPKRLKNDFIPYRTGDALKTYEPTVNFLEYIKQQSDNKKTEIVFSIYPYPWMVSVEESIPYQVLTLNGVYDLRKNRVHRYLMQSISTKLDVRLLDAYPIFENLPKGYYGEYDPHFNAKGYTRYAKFIYNSIKDQVSRDIIKKYGSL